MGLPRNYLKARRALEEATTQAQNRPQISVTSEASSTRVNIYAEIGLWGVTSSDVAAAFAEIPSTHRVDVHINSPGGDVYDGLAIYQTIRSAPQTVAVHIDGLAASAASYIAMAGDTVEMGRNARFMIHDASTFTFGNPQDHLDTAKWLSEESDNIADIYTQRAGGTVASWRDKMRDETWYSAQQALDAGLIDVIQGAEDAASRSVAASLFKNTSHSPGGPAAPDTEPEPEIDNEFDFEQVANALKGAFS